MAKERLLSALKAWDCDTEGAMGRMLDDLDFYIDCLNRFLDDGSFLKLDDALKHGDARAAFEASHDIKGVAGTLGLTKMYELANDLTEPLRAGSLAGAAARVVTLKDMRTGLDGILRDCEVRAS